MKKTHIKFAAAVFAAIFLLAGCAEKADHMQQGKEALLGANFEPAAKEFEIFIAEQEELEVKGTEDEERKKINISEAYLGIGIARFEQKRYEEAEGAFREAIKTSGVNTPLLCRFIGLCLMEQEKYEEALDFFSEGVRLTSEETRVLEDGENPDGYKESIREMRLLSIDCYEKLRDWKNADKAAQRYLDEYPDDEAVKREGKFLKTRINEAKVTEELLKAK